MRGLMVVALGLLWLWWCQPTYAQFYGWQSVVMSAAILIGAVIVLSGFVMMISRRSSCR